MSIDRRLREAWSRVPGPSAVQRTSARASLERLVAAGGQPASGQRRTRAIWRVGTTAAGLAAITGLLIAALPKGTDGPPAGTTPTATFPSVSLLTEPPTPEDQAQSRNPGVFAPDLVDATTLRFAGFVDGTRYFAASGTRGDVVCVLTTRAGTDSGNVCGPPGALGRYGLVASISPPRASDDPQRTIVGVVPDGIDRVQIADSTTTVMRNVFILRPTALRSTVTLVGPSAAMVGTLAGEKWERSEDANGVPTVTVPLVPEGVVVPGMTTTAEPPKGVLIGNRVVAVVAVPSNIPLTAAGTVTVPTTKALKWRVAVLNTGDTVATDVVVKATYRQPATAPNARVTTSATIPRIAPGATEAVEIDGPPIDSFAIGATGVLQVVVEPVPGEQNVGNNSIDLPVKIDFG